MSKTSKPRRGEVWLVQFDPSIGAEIQKLRPAVVISTNDVGRLPLRIVVPITNWHPQLALLSWFVPIPASTANGLSKDSAADGFQVKSISESRFVRKLGILTDEIVNDIASTIALCVGVD